MSNTIQNNRIRFSQFLKSDRIDLRQKKIWIYYSYLNFAKDNWGHVFIVTMYILQVIILAKHPALGKSLQSRSISGKKGY